MDGTYIKDAGGQLLYSDKWSRSWLDPAIGLEKYPETFEPVVKGGALWDEDAENEAQYLVPGEWLKIAGPVMEIGGAM